MGRHKTAIALGATLLLWASAFAGIRAGLRGYSPFHLAVGRFLVASFVLALMAILKRTQLPALTDLLRIFLTGFFGIAAYNVALNYGELTVTAGGASFIVNTVPIFTTLLSILFLHERIQAFGWLGMIVSFAGVSLIAVAESGGLQFNNGALLVLCAAVFQSLYFVLQKPLLKKYGVFAVVCYSIWVGTLCLLIFLPGLSRAIKNASPAATLAVLYLGVFPAAFAYFCWSFVLSKVPASRASAFLYLVPAISIVIGYVWLKEVPARLSLIGGCMALGWCCAGKHVGEAANT